MSEPIPDVPDVVAARALLALVELIHTDPVARPLSEVVDGVYAGRVTLSRGALRLVAPKYGVSTVQMAVARALFGGEATVLPGHNPGYERHVLATTWQGVPLEVEVEAQRADEVAALREQVDQLTADLTAARAEAGALAEQRHQMYDPAVPPLAAAGVVAQ